ncbi:MAG: hypothetical protein WKF30_13955, partial [Pyrinomonadaceae bacterium]
GRRVWQSLKFTEIEQKSFANGKAFDILTLRNVVTGAAMAFRAKYKGLLLPIPDDLTQDDLILIHDGWVALIISAVSKIAFIADPLIEYRLHPGQQLGIRAVQVQPPPEAHSMLSDLAQAARRSNSYAAQIKQLQAIRARLAAHRNGSDLGAALASIDERLTHLKARSSLPASKVRRLPVVLREAWSLRYMRYSNGIYSLMKDMLA